MELDGRLKNNFGLYIHFPFCKRVCFYCHFTKQKFDTELANKYINFLIKELELKGDKSLTVDTVYFGGGSPGLINNTDIVRIIKTISDNFNLDTKSEITIEVNPEDADYDKLFFLKSVGFNRLSVGTQSFEKKDLAYLKRFHSAEHSLLVLKQAQQAGFTNINADFIIGLPTQTRATLIRGFKKIKKLNISHISVYILEGVKKENEKENSIDEYLYFQSEENLNALDYRRYEISNYSLANFESVHNNKYWENKEYIAVGLSASGYEKGIDYKNTLNLKEYFSILKNNKLPIKEKQKIDTTKRAVITGLRTSKGVNCKYFTKYKDQLELLIKEKILIKQGSNIKVFPKKILLLNEILTYFT